MNIKKFQNFLNLADQGPTRRTRVAYMLGFSYGLVTAAPNDEHVEAWSELLIAAAIDHVSAKDWLAHIQNECLCGECVCDDPDCENPRPGHPNFKG